jgi:NADPH:quinone reductase-like Zn-dependent oxidoreductase
MTEETIPMKAIVVTDQAAGTAGMTLVQRPEPRAAINDVVVEVHASGFVPTELAKEDGHQPGPAAFAVIADQAASGRNASVVSAHTAQEIICLVSVAAPDRSSAVAVTLAVVADALTAVSRLPSPSR